MKLTREQILAMTVDELNDAVARHFMGWIPGPKYWMDPEHPEALHGTGFSTPEFYDWDIGPFCPAGCIEHAWLILEKVLKKGIFLSIMHGGQHWTFTWVTPPAWRGLEYDRVRHASLFIAICQGALISLSQMKEAPNG